MDMLYLNGEQIESMRIPIREVIEVIEEGFQLKGEGLVQLPGSQGVYPREDCFIDAMPAYFAGSADTAGIKWVSGYPTNLEKGLPNIMGLIVINDAETGAPMAVMDAKWITAYRSGAATAVTAKHLAPEKVSTLSIIGLGVQGRTNLLGLRETMKGLRRVTVYDKSEANARKYLEDMQTRVHGVEIEICPDVRSAVKDADVIVTCTPVHRKPDRFIPADWLKKDVLAVSADNDSAFEGEVMTGASFFVTDDRGQYLQTQKAGTYFRGYPEEVPADMGEICAGIVEVPRTPGRKAAVLMGIGSHDVATARVIFEKAQRIGLGTRLSL
ncbi:MAG TPA: peptide transporter [Synergistaceae bacterium]|nr:peptide transporter [Synergistaceae bacterium]